MRIIYLAGTQNFQKNYLLPPEMQSDVCVSGSNKCYFFGTFCVPIKWMITLREKCPYSELFWSVFPRIWTEYGEIQNTNQNKSEYVHFFQSVICCNSALINRAVRFILLYFSVNRIRQGVWILETIFKFTIFDY